MQQPHVFEQEPHVAQPLQPELDNVMTLTEDEYSVIVHPAHRDTSENAETFMHSVANQAKEIAAEIGSRVIGVGRFVAEAVVRRNAVRQDTVESVESMPVRLVSRAKNLGKRAVASVMETKVVKSYQAHRADIKQDDKMDFVFEGMDTHGVDSSYVAQHNRVAEEVTIEPGRKWATIYMPERQPVTVPTMEVPRRTPGTTPPEPEPQPARPYDGPGARRMDIMNRLETRHIELSPKVDPNRPKDLADVLASEAAVKAVTTTPETTDLHGLMLIDAMGERPADLGELQAVETRLRADAREVTEQYARYHRAETLEDVLHGEPVGARR
jgi:hypothetical protein